MIQIDKENQFYAFSEGMTAAVEADDGDILRFHTVDCYADLLREGMIWDDIADRAPEANPATGPVYIRGAKKGDTLKVEILSITPADHGVMHVSTRSGGLKRAIEFEETCEFPIISSQWFDFDGIRLPLRPMIGVIGVAPQQGCIDTNTPHQHGGNMDNREITAGCTMYFPVHQDGAFFGLGDVHGQMGDGEVCVCGLEMAASVDVLVTVIKGRQEPSPMWEKDGLWASMWSAKTLDEAAEGARYQMLDFLKKRVDMPVNHLAMLLSLVGDTAVCQVVDPLQTVRFTLRERVFDLHF